MLDKKYKHDIAVVVDRLVMRADLRKRLADSIETAVALAEGIVEVELRRRGRRRGADLLRALRLPELRHVDARARAAHLLLQLARTAPARAAPGWARRWRSTPSWWCPTRRCRSARGRSCPWSTSASNYYEQITQAIAERYEVDLDTPWEELPEEQRDLLPLRHQRRPDLRLLPQPHGPPALLHDDASRGSSPTSSAATARPTPTTSREKIEEYMSVRPCPECKGARLRPESLRGAGRRDRRSTSSPRCRAQRALEWLERRRAHRDASARSPG